MNYYLLISMIAAAVAGIFSLVYQFQMLQQNSYFPSRYTKWVKSNISSLSAFGFLISSLLFCFDLFSFQMFFIALFLGISVNQCFYMQKKSIKKLVFTGRIKRLFGAATIVYALLILLFVFLCNTVAGNLIAIISFTLSFITPVMTYIAWALTLPIEKAFSKWYVKDAKRILKSHSNLKVIGITGSYGKTTTKFILTRILSEKFNTLCTPHSFNTPMGVVRTVRESLKPQTQVFVCEMGAKNIGDIKEICDIVNPDYALITSVGSQHLETFKTVDNVFKTKFELSDASKNIPFVNGDSAEIISRIDPKKFNVYGTDSNFKYSAQNISYGRNGSEFEVMLGGAPVKLTSRLLGLHSIINITGAAGLAYELGVSPQDIQYAVASLKPTEHRLEMKTGINGSLVIDDAYNANPEGCIEAVRVLGSFKGMKKAIITPGLIELGDKEYDCNYALGLEAAKECDIIILVGLNRSKPMADAVRASNFPEDKLFIAASFKEAMEIYSKFADNNSVVLLENDLPDNYLN